MTEVSKIMDRVATPPLSKVSEFKAPNEIDLKQQILYKEGSISSYSALHHRTILS